MGSWGPLGASLGASWELPGASGGLLGASGVLLGPSWEPLGGFWGFLGASWQHLCYELISGGEAEATWSRLGAVLGPSWPPPGPSVESSWDLWGLSWRLWGLSWSLLGASRGRLEAILDVFRRITAKCSKMQPLPREMLFFAFKMRPR